MVGSLRGIKASFDELDANPEEPHTTIDEQELKALGAFARSQGVLSVGYAVVPPRLAFWGKAVLHAYAVVLTMEVDKARTRYGTAQGGRCRCARDTQLLGQVSNKVARYLRAQGFSAHAGHPLNGLALYPPLAEAAHLGGRGMHGLLITPEMDPTVRLAAVFTSIENLPVPQGENPHAWVTEFCDHCRHCVRECPVDAIYTNPIEHPDGRLSCVDDAKCLPFFAVNDGCSICVAVCPFDKVGYERLHRSVLASGHHQAVEEHVARKMVADA